MFFLAAGSKQRAKYAFFADLESFLGNKLCEAAPLEPGMKSKDVKMVKICGALNEMQRVPGYKI